MARSNSPFIHDQGLGAWLSWALRAAIGLVAAAHLYALVLVAAPAPGSILMAQRRAAGVTVYRTPLPLDQVSPHLVRAVIAAEDARFCEHRGVDVAATQEAYAEWRRGGRLRGASTLTQQTAKNIFLWNGGGLARKAPEAWFALVIDLVWGKRRVMTAYLNIAEWGDGLFGAEAAARGRFGKPASDLTRREAALLAAVLPSPNKWSASRPGPYVRSRAATIEARMRVVEAEGLGDCVLGPP